jgi:hypothetical protein
MDADWSMQDGRYDQSPDQDDDESDGAPYGPRRDIKPGNTAKFFIADVASNRTWFLCYKEDDLHADLALLESVKEVVYNHNEKSKQASGHFKLRHIII